MGEIDFNDILFETKNKAYGAYVLRKLSLKYLMSSFGISLIIILVSFLIPFLVKVLSADKEGPLKIKQKKVVSYTELSAPPPIEITPPVEPVKPPPKKTVKKYLPPVAKKDEEVVDEEIIPTQEELKTVDAGTTNVEADDSIFYEGEPEVIEEEKPFLFVQHMPEFPGGETALLNYLSSNLRYPEIAREFGVEGMVVVRFVVNKTGKVSDVEVMRGIGMGCDEEALRVIKAMPDWKPGKQGDRPVKVYFTVPIQFRIKY